MNFIVAMILALLLDTAIFAVDAPTWFCILFGCMSFISCKYIVDLVIG